MNKILVSLLLICSITHAQNSKSPDVKEISNQDIEILALSKVLDSIKGAFKELKEGGQFVGKAEVDLSFNNVTTVEKNGEINLYIFKIGKKRKTDKSRTITYSFEIDKSTANKSFQLKKELAKSINRAIAGFKTIKELGTEISAKSFTVEIGFTMEDNGTRGIKFDIAPVMISGSRSKTRKTVHTIKIKINPS